MAEDEGTPTFEAYKSPAERLKQLIIKLLEESITHYSKSYNNKDESFAFIIKTRCLSDCLLRWTGKTARAELLQWYKQLDEKVKEIKEAKNLTVTDDKRDDMILKLKFQYAEEVRKHNTIVIQNDYDMNMITSDMN